MMLSTMWHRLPACVEKRTARRKSIASTAILLLLIMPFLGCTTDTAPKTSHFEHDHDIAAHWPSDLADAATKIRDRMAWLKDGKVPESHDHESDHHDDHHEHDHDHDHGHEHDSDPLLEIVELVSWIPEIAADTNLFESDWLPLYHATESLSANLQSAGDVLTDNNRQQLESLCQLVDDAVNKIPKQPTRLVEVEL